jgi:queuine/archaeosine tRNA-ribosyltransferase
MLYRQRTLRTPHGDLETPTLFPVRNVGTRSTDNTPPYDEIPDLSTAMVNAWAIRRRDTQWERLRRGVDLRQVIDAPEDTIVFADSGGFQFQHEQVDTTPTETLETQYTIGADLLGTVDLPLSPENRTAENQRRIKRSTKLALAANEAHSGEGLLFASVHGYTPADIRNNIRHLERNGDFDGFAIGSLVPIRGQYQRVTKLILAARRTIDKHLHVYGLGGFLYQPLLMYLGVDSFDSSAFIRSASHRRYYVPGLGGVRLKNVETLQHLPCACPICRQRKLDAVRSSRDLLVQHNLWAIMTELRRFRYIAESGEDLEAYLDLRFRGNDVTHRAYQTAKQQMRRLA